MTTPSRTHRRLGAALALCALVALAGPARADEPRAGAVLTQVARPAVRPVPVRRALVPVRPLPAVAAAVPYRFASLLILGVGY